jgi:hypothetical protein
VVLAANWVPFGGLPIVAWVKGVESGGKYDGVATELLRKRNASTRQGNRRKVSFYQYFGHEAREIEASVQHRGGRGVLRAPND